MQTAVLQQPQQQQIGTASMVNPAHARPQLRRAVYIHVSDVTNAYNIDHAKLEEELARVKVHRDNMAEANNERLGIPTEFEASTTQQKRLQPPRGGYNLCVLVGGVEIVVDKNRVDGSRVRLAEVEVGDETGVVSLRARDDQIDVLQDVSERSGAVVLRNCTLELYQGKHIRLAVTKWGKLNTYPDQVASTPPPPSKINYDRNFSMIDLSAVASEMVAFSQSEQYSMGDDRSQASSMNRMPAYPSDASRRGRRPSRGAKHPTMPVHYPDNSGMQVNMRYPGLPGSYGGGHGDGMDMHQYGYPMQRDVLPGQQHMMLQQQYEMQHRQMHHMYHSGQDRSVPTHMMVPGVSGAPTFDSNYGSEAPGVLMGSGQFLMPAQHRSDSPQAPGKMNPQAATFDPGRRPHQG